MDIKTPSPLWKLLPGARFSEMAAAWDALNARGPNSPVLESGFMGPALECFGNGTEILAILEQGGEMLAMALLRRKNALVWETFQPSQAPLGAWLSAKETLARDAAGLLAGLPGFGLLLGVTQLDPDLFLRPSDSAAMHSVDYIQTARISVTGSFDEYWAARGKNLRQNMKRQRNLLERENIVTRMETLENADEVSNAIAEYGRIETAGWKAQGGTAIAPDNAQGRFYTKMLKNFAANQRAHIYKYWYNDRVAAMDLCISRNGVIVILKTTYDESIQSTSPAMLMRQDAFKDFFTQRHFSCIEFYGKLMEWHTRWSNEARQLYHLNFYRWRLLATLRGRHSTESPP